MDFYHIEPSPPCRAAALTAKALGINLNKKVVNLLEGEQKKPEYVAINFQHTVPTLVDGNFTMWESRAIMGYLVNKYGKDDSLYPKDPETRAMVDRLLYFDEGTFWSRFRQYFAPVAFAGQKPDPTKLEAIHGGFEFLEKFLDGHDFAVGNNITIADHSLIASVSSIEESGFVDIGKYKNVIAWSKRCKAQMPGYETENGNGARRFGAFAKEKLSNA